MEKAEVKGLYTIRSLVIIHALCVWFNARLSKIEHNAPRTNPLPGIEFANVTESQMPGISVVF
jgi:hypothetical protein